METLRTLRTALLALALLTFLTGVAYPAMVTFVASGLFPAQAAGSLVYEGPVALGSSLIGQCITEPGLFHGRPNGVGDEACKAHLSGGSNLGPKNPALAAAVAARKAEGAVAEQLTASASGLDPHVSPAAANVQIARISEATGISVANLEGEIAILTEAPTFGVFGEPRVNVLALNRWVRKNTLRTEAPHTH